jgi:hypothetical protein
MEQKKPLTHTMAGLMIAGIVIVISLVMMLFAKSQSSPGSGWLTYGVIILGLIFTINMYAKSKNNFVTFGELFSYGFKATAVYTVIFIGFLILVNIMFPEFKQSAIDAVRTEMENQKNYNEDQAEMAIEMIEKNFWIFAVGGTMLGFVIVGAIGSLLGAAITKKRPINPFEQQAQ